MLPCSVSYCLGRVLINWDCPALAGSVASDQANLFEGPGRASVKRTALALIAAEWRGLTVATRHAALHAASHARPGELCAASHAAASRPSGRQHVTPLAVAPQSPHFLATIEARRAP